MKTEDPCMCNKDLVRPYIYIRYCRRILYHLSHQGNPLYIDIDVYMYICVYMCMCVYMWYI